LGRSALCAREPAVNASFMQQSFRRVVVVAMDSYLRNAVSARLQPHAPGGFIASDSLDAAAPDDIVLVPERECPPARCQMLARQGARIIILSALPNDRQRAAYARAGADAYVTLSTDPAALIGAVTQQPTAALPPLP
jgi:DNA-binding response OmpR family regulator